MKTTLKILWARFIRQWWHVPSHLFGRNKPRLPVCTDVWLFNLKRGKNILEMDICLNVTTRVIACECGWERRFEIETFKEML